MAFLSKNVTRQPVDYGTMIVAGLVKYGEERMLAPIIGNGTLVSAAVKGVAGYAAHHFVGGGTIGDGVALGFTVDAVEDGLTALIGGGLSGIFGGGAQASANVW